MITEKEIQAVIALNVKGRYKYSLNRMADFSEVWVLSDSEGFLTYADADNITYFPIWPFKEYAALCAIEEFKNGVPESIEIHDFINEYLPDFREQKIKLSLFPLPSNWGLPIEIDDFINDIQIALDEIE